MHIEANIKRSDILRTILFHGRSKWRLLSLCVVGYCVVLWSLWHSPNRPEDLQQIIYDLTLCTAYFVGLFCVLFLYIAIASVFRSSSAPGVIGIHKFEIKDEGLYEETAANQTLARWISIKKAVRDKHQIVVWVAPWLFHTIPRRAFKTEEEYMAFYGEILKRFQKTA